jgi:hypothetical protein
MARFRSRLNHTTVVAYLALFAALGGGAVAATRFVGSDGQIHGCVSKKGKLRLIKAGKHCGKGKHRIAWNQRGPQGIRGIQGPPGPTFGATALGQASDPPAGPDESSGSAAGSGRHFAFTLPAAGKVYVRYFSPSLTRNCSTGAARAGLYLDGAPVPKSDQQIGPEVIEVVSVTPAAAGPHAVELREDCPAGDLAIGSDVPNSTWTVLLLGG